MNILANLVAYLTRMVLARNLTPAEYGLFYAVFTFVIFFLFFRNLGLGSAMVKYIAEFKIKKKYNAIKTAIISAASFQFLSSLIYGAIFFLSADFLAKYYFKNPLSSIMLKLLVLYVLLSILFIICKNILQGFQKFKVFSLVEFSKNSIVLLLLLLFFYIGMKNVFAPIFAYILVCPILFLILLPFALKAFPFFKYKTENFKPITKQLFLFGLPVLVTSVGGKVIGYVDTLILTHFRTLEEVGIYNVILPSAMLFLYFGISASAVAFPIVSELWAKKDKKRLSGGLKLLHKYAFVLIIPLVFTVFAFSSLFIKLFFGKEYIAGALALQILLVGVLFYIVAGINNNIIAAIGRPKTVTKIILFSAFINLIANIILIPRYGIEGAAIATSISYLIALLLSTYKVTKFIKIGFPKIIWLKLILAGIVFVLTISYIKDLLVLNPWIELIISAIVAFLIYVVMVYLLKVVDIQEIKKNIMLAK